MLRPTTLVAALATLLFLLGPILAAPALPPSPWRSPTVPHLALAAPNAEGITRVTSTAATESTLDSVAALPAAVGDSFELNVRLRAGLETRALPELVCYDAANREIPTPSSLARGTIHVTTAWQTFHRVFPAQPGTATVRARIRLEGRGHVDIAALEFRRATNVDPYATGALITQPHPKVRTTGALLLESNFGIQNPDTVTADDRDGDGKWAVITVDLDRLSAPAQTGEDWRTGFEDNPNAIFWSDGAVLKSDSIHADRAPDRHRALHFRASAHVGPYRVKISDPGRAVAVSLDGRTWTRHPGGREIDLGELPLADSVVEFWLDACYRDPVSVGPAYFDYVSLTPVRRAPSVEKLLAAASRPAPQLAVGTAEEQAVPLTLDLPPSLASSNNGSGLWPVRCGLPLPRGHLVGAENISVFDARDRPVATQTRVLATWPDGSARWIHLDFLHDLATPATYTVRYGKRIRPPAATTASPLSITRDPEGLRVSTGALAFTVSAQRFGLIERVTLPSGDLVQAAPISAEITETDGTLWRALDLPVARLELEQSGPLHAVILVETPLAPSGAPARGFHHRARIHAFAGSPVVQFEYFAANTDSRSSPPVEHGGSMAGHVPVRSFTLKLPLASPVVTAPGADLQITATPAAPPLLGARTFALANRTSLLLGVADFRAQFPKALRWSAHGVQADLWAEEGGEFQWIEGIGKTHTLTLAYLTADTAALPGNPTTLTALAAHGPLLALPSPEWFVRSGAFGAIDLAAPSPLPEVEATLARHIRDVMVGRMGLGFEHYGDHSSSGYVKGAFLWDNNEYDAAAGCLVHFARTGDRAALHAGLAGARHYLDVDTIHYSSRHADWAGAHHVHSHAVYGHHTAQGPDYHHAGAIQGLLLHYYLTGDPSALRGARSIGDWCVRNLDQVTIGTMERAMGHPLMTFMDLYEATHDTTYLRAAAQLVDLALKWEHPVRSGFYHALTESPAYYSGAPFTGGLLTTGLMNFNARAQLPEINALLQRVAHWTLTDVWRPGGLQGKGGRPREQPSPLNATNHARTFAHVFAQTRDPFFLLLPRELAQQALASPTRVIGSRSTGLVFNYLPTLLSTLTAAGDPRPDTELEISLVTPELRIRRGERATLAFTLHNRGPQPITDLQTILRARRDIALTPLSPVPSALAPGETVSLTYELRAPERLNLSTVYHREAYVHLLSHHRRSAPGYTHRWLKVVFTE